MNQSLSYEIAQVMPAAFATGLFVSVASFFEPNPAQGPTGNSIGGYLALADLQGIPAMSAPESVRSVSSTETRLLAYTEAERVRHMLLKGFYPDLDTGFATGAGLGWQVNVDGDLYDFLGGEGDSQSQMTRVKMQLVTV